MKMDKKTIILFVASATFLAAVGFVLFGWPHVYDYLFPPHYEDLEQRAEAAERYCKRHGLRTDYCVFVDFSKESSERRFVIYDLKNRRVEYGGLVAHGRGKPSTTKRAAFSNKPGSMCSSVGKFHVAEYGKRKKVGRCYALDGAELLRNGNARMRGILIHTSRLVQLHETKLRGVNIPLSDASWGCFTISGTLFDKFREIEQQSKKHMLLWAFDGEKY